LHKNAAKCCQKSTTPRPKNDPAATKNQQSGDHKLSTQKRKKVAAAAKKCGRPLFSKLKIAAKSIKNMYKKRTNNDRLKKVSGKKQQKNGPALNFCKPFPESLGAQIYIFGSLEMIFRLAGIEKCTGPTPMARHSPGSRGTGPQTPCGE
jgi:hypothetical protein